MEMAGKPIEQLHLSVRASNVLHRMGIHSVEELLKTPIESIAQQRNIGIKTLDEITRVLEGAGFIMGQAADEFAIESIATEEFTDEQLSEMSRHSIDELKLPVRPYNALHGGECLTIDKVALLTESDFVKMKSLGRKSVEKIKESVDLWVRENIAFETDSLQDSIDAGQKNLLQEIAAALEPIAHLHWKQIY